ncbi:EAL domain-containing protein [Ferrovibrio sp.]|uniref:EAL domain-containing protein n=1 Tax=Ferrovibrio sp. TaxID=1917215 RepID=UPI0025BC1EAE|nr:EAL domain-containing protein [Ferrovibrio sp.]
MPTLLTFAALSLIALVAGVSLTRLVPGLSAQHPGILALGLLMLFWAVREILLRRRVQKRLLAEIEELAEEVLRLRDQEAVPTMVPGMIDVQPEALAARQPANEPRLTVPDPLRAPAPADDGTLLEAVRDALNNNRVELHVQPIVTLPQRKIRFFELLARPRDADGKAYPAAACLQALDAAGLRAEFDALMLLRGVQMVRKLEQRAKDVGFFLNLSPDMLAQIETFNPLYDFLTREREHAANIVLEFSYEGVRLLDRNGLYRLGQLSALGFALSLDGIDRLDLDFAALAKTGVRFLKFNAGCFTDPAVISRATVDPADLAEICRRHDLMPVLAKVEKENELLKLAELNFPFGQGLLFGPPKMAKAA